MNTSLKFTLRTARHLQKRYERIPVATTQNVRNPKPIWKLILEILPVVHTIEDLNRIINIPITSQYGASENVIQLRMASLLLRIKLETARLTDRDFGKGITFDELVNQIKSRGYLVNSIQTVRMTLFSLKRKCLIRSISSRKDGRYSFYSRPS